MIDQSTFSARNRILGIIAAWSVFFFGVLYAITTVLGFLSLKSPLDPISDPFFTIMEILTIIIATLLVMLMVSIHKYASVDLKGHSLTALVFMSIMAGITCAVHFSVLTIARHFKDAGLAWSELYFSFQWPSLVYALDILAWDWFFALSVLFAAPVFRSGRLENMVRNMMILSAILSLAGLIGVPLGNMNIRNIGIIGYAMVAPVAFLLTGVIFLKIQPSSTNNDSSIS